MDGTDPLASWFAIRKGMEYCRTQRRPYLIEAMVTRLYGHSSSSGSPRANEADCLPMFEQRLLERRADRAGSQSTRCTPQASRRDRTGSGDGGPKEPRPRPEDVEKFTYAPSRVDAVYPGDYTGLPQETLPVSGKLGARAMNGNEREVEMQRLAATPWPSAGVHASQIDSRVR